MHMFSVSLSLLDLSLIRSKDGGGELVRVTGIVECRERGGAGRVAALRLKSFIKIKLKGTKPSKINVKGTLSLNWVLRDIFFF